MNLEMEEYRSGKKSLELTLYIVGAGAFGVFLRWLQLQLAFNELGLPDPSLFHIVLVLYFVACAGMFLYFIRRYSQSRLYPPDDFPAAFGNIGKIYLAVRIAVGMLVFAGAVLLFMQTELDKNSTDYRILAGLAMLAGAAFPVWLTLANREIQPKSWILCALSFLPMFFFAVWMVICYKLNTINSVLWSFAVELIAIAFSMLAFFRLGGYVFGRPRWKHCLFTCAMAAVFCITCLAEERYLGMQLIFIGTAGELLLCSWILVTHFLKGETPPKREKDSGGFETL